MKTMIGTDEKFWCDCGSWKRGDWRNLANHSRMNFCAFCGNKLVKERKLRPVPKSLVGKCVGHHPDRRIFRNVSQFGGPERLMRAHPATCIEATDVWCR